VSVTILRPSLVSAPPDKGIGPRRWTRQEYYRAAELGLFRPDERLELLDGEIIRQMTHKPPHAVAVGQAADVLTQVFGPGHHARSQLPLILSNRSEPEPDLVMVPGRRADYVSEHPKAADALLVVEVADTTLRFDRGRKRAAYARSSVRDYWIINLLHRQVEVYRDPSGARYRSVTVYDENETITPLSAPFATVPVSDLLPPSDSPRTASRISGG
jgi:Uma2 family endonuclease